MFLSSQLLMLVTKEALLQTFRITEKVRNVPFPSPPPPKKQNHMLYSTQLSRYQPVLFLEKGVFHLVARVGHKKFWSPHMISVLDFQIPCLDALPLSLRLYGEQGPSGSSYMTHVLHTAGISNFNVL